MFQSNGMKIAFPNFFLVSKKQRVIVKRKEINILFLDLSIISSYIPPNHLPNIRYGYVQFHNEEDVDNAAGILRNSGHPNVIGYINFNV